MVDPIGNLNWNSDGNSYGGRSKLLPRPMGRFTQGIHNGIYNLVFPWLTERTPSNGGADLELAFMDGIHDWYFHGCRSKQFDYAHRDAPATADWPIYNLEYQFTLISASGCSIRKAWICCTIGLSDVEIMLTSY